MKIHVVGYGGRAHAIAWKLAQSPSVASIVCAPGNGGIAMERLQNGKLVQCVPVPPKNIEGQLALANVCDSDITICQEDDPLALGIVDLFRAAGRRIWGPNRAAARFEWSKIWAWEFMRKYGIPTPDGKACDSGSEVVEFAKTLGYQCAVKVDGLALGKGSLMCSSENEVEAACYRIFVKKEFGDAGTRVLVQEFVDGEELSLHFLCSKGRAIQFPGSKDHKRELDGEKGEMTGGMGAVCPSPDLSPRDVERIGESIIYPWLEGCEREGIDFRGILYPGVKLTQEGPKVLEFNARFGDPETQVYLTLLESNLLDPIIASVQGRDLSQGMFKWSADTSVCVVMAAPGYPKKYEKQKRITGLDNVAQLSNVKVFHAGTAKQGDDIVTNGGRVLGVTAWAPELEEARWRAYRAVNMIKFEGGQHFRRDIGGPPLEME